MKRAFARSLFSEFRIGFQGDMDFLFRLANVEFVLRIYVSGVYDHIDKGD